MEISAYGKRTDSSGRVSTWEHHAYYVEEAKVAFWLPGNRMRVVKFKDGVEPMTIISDELLQRIVRSAFKAGENWGLTYEWFTPTAADHKKKMNNAIRAARKVVQRSNSKKG